MTELLERKILRIGLSLVILWFGVSQLLNPQQWIGFVPGWLENIAPLITFVYINAVFEIAFSLLILSNNFVKLSSILLSIHLVIIILELGYNGVAVRDVGIVVGFLSLIAMEKGKKLFLYN